MGEVEEHRYICRICSKICVSGKSLGGHMRLHLSQISASKKAAAAAAQEREDEEEEISMDQSNSSSEEKMQTKMEMEMNSGAAEMEADGDQSNNIYELRENPKKSWRISDPKHALTSAATSNPCRECGRGFASLRALSGHMRCHSVKNRRKEVHHCRECGRGFDSIRAMFGHMKCHSKRGMVKLPSLEVEPAESLSDLENFCPVRRKRSRIRYKGTVNPSFSGGSDSVVSEVEEAEEAAKCLVMLSRGLRSWSRLESSNVGSDDDDHDDDDSASCRSKKLKFCGDFVKGFDEHDLDKVLVLENGIDVDFVCDDQFLKSGFERNSCENGDDLEMKKPKVQKSSSNLCRIGSLLSVNGASDPTNEVCSEEDQLETEVRSVVSLISEPSKSKKRECPICFKVFSSGQALGGHKRAHYNGVVEAKNREAAEDEDRGVLDLNFPISGDVGLESWLVETKHEAVMLTT